MSDDVKQRVLSLAISILRDKERAEIWLASPKRRFDGKTPLEILESSAGAEQVEEVLRQAYFGYVG